MFKGSLCSFCFQTSLHLPIFVPTLDSCLLLPGSLGPAHTWVQFLQSKDFCPPRGGEGSHPAAGVRCGIPAFLTRFQPLCGTLQPPRLPGAWGLPGTLEADQLGRNLRRPRWRFSRLLPGAALSCPFQPADVSSLPPWIQLSLCI